MIDAAALAAGFDRALATRGVLAGVRRAQTFAEVLVRFPPEVTAGLYWRARTSMLGDIADVAQFNAAFLEYFSAFGDADALAALVHMVDAAPPRSSEAKRETLPPPPSERPADAESAERAPVQFIAASLETRVADRDFDDLSAVELAQMNRLIERARVAAEYRTSRRRAPHARGDRFDFRSTIRGAARTAGELVQRRATKRRTRLRPLIFLIDVSGSMTPFARALVQYARVSATARPRVRAFAFATALSDLTPLLRRASNERLMSAIGVAMRDFGGGTRIGGALATFNTEYAQRGVARGGTVVILSDGWEREDPQRVRTEMERLHRLARRIVWVNPHKRHPAYEPLARGMAAALPFVDAFVSGHNLRSLETVARAIEGTHHENR